MREKAYSEFRPLLQKISNSCFEQPGEYAFNGKTPVLCPDEYFDKINKAINKIDSTKDDLGHLEWTPGLYLAAKAATKVLADQPQDILKEITYDKVYESMNLDDWGYTGQVSSAFLFQGDDTPENAVARMLIDDFANTATDVLLNTAVNQVGVAMEPSASA